MVLFAKDIAEKEFLQLGQETSALEAARIMAESKHGFVVVKSSDGQPTGIVTEWDYLSKITAQGKDPSKIKLEEIMTGKLVTVDANVGIDQVAQLMSERGVRR